MSTMIASRQVFPIGYSTLGSQERIDELMSGEKMLLIDTRAEKDLYLKNLYGECYRYAGSHLGENWTETGIRGLMRYLKEEHDLVLLCSCQQCDENCHLNQIVRLLSEQVAVNVVREQPQTREAALPIVELNSYIEKIEPSDLPLIDEACYCTVCGEPATLFSKSGRPEGMYCEKHGHCLRCGGSIELFVKYPYGNLYVCSCVLEYYEQTRLNEELKQAKPVAFGF